MRLPRVGMDGRCLPRPAQFRDQHTGVETIHRDFTGISISLRNENRTVYPFNPSLQYLLELGGVVMFPLLSRSNEFGRCVPLALLRDGIVEDADIRTLAGSSAITAQSGTRAAISTARSPLRCIQNNDAFEVPESSDELQHRPALRQRQGRLQIDVAAAMRGRRVHSQPRGNAVDW
jgi:hypothetical protein